MFMATLYVSMDLEPEVPTVDREKVLRSLRDRLRQFYNHRAVIRTDEDTALFVSLFDENHERAKSRIDEVLEKIETASEARVFDSQIQIFEWFEGSFVETREDLEDESAARDPRSRSSRTSKDSSKMIVYGEEEDEDFSPMPTRFNRRTMRLPTRK